MTARRWYLVVLGLSVLSSAVLAAPVGPANGPAVWSWSGFEAWYAEAGPAPAAIAIVRLVALGGAGWLALASAAQVVAGLACSRWLSGLADRLTPRLVRTVATGAASLSVTAGLSLPPVLAGPLDDAPSTAVMVPLDTPTPSSTTTTAELPEATTTTVPTDLPPAQPVAAPPVPDHDEVVVEAGDSFWSIAVDEAQGRDVTSYWRALIAANRDRLVDPANPDLLYPGQALALP